MYEHPVHCLPTGKHVVSEAAQEIFNLRRCGKKRAANARLRKFKKDHPHLVEALEMDLLCTALTYSG